MDKVLIVGSTGLLGLHLVSFLKNKKYRIYKFKNNKYNDLSKKSFCKIFFKKNKFDIIINLAAITDVDYCEKNKKHALKVNFNLCKNIYSFSKINNYDIFFINLSTDQFYNNFKENFENVNRIYNYYTKTKHLTENYMKNKNAVILRTNFFGKSLNQKKRKSFTDQIYDNLKINKYINMSDDILFNPVSIETLCKIIFILMKKKTKGLFNVGSNGGLSKYKFAVNFATRLKLDKKLINKVKMKDINFIAKRSKDMRMQNKLFEKMFKYKFNSLKFEINKVSKSYDKKI